MRLSAAKTLAITGLLAIAAPAGRATDEFERPPIAYSQSEPANRVAKLKSRLDRGELQLDYDDEFGYLRAFLEALDVPVDSQVLVFSKTSMQRHRISPRTPRAIYFADDVYVGYCQSGEVIEVSAADPQLGAVFYTLGQNNLEEPRLLRQTDNCLLCHSSSRTEGVPGHVVRSLFVSSDGQPLLSAGSYTVDHTTPLEQRWGGWYVSGTHGAQEHLGNLIVRGRDVPRPVENSQGQNVTRLDDRLAVEKYLTPHSDIVALMVLEHQTLVHNRLTKANFTARQALQYDREMTRVLDKPAGERLESTTRRIHSAGDDLVEALLLVDEATLTEPIRGTSGYAARFAAAGPRDSQDRSLRQLDLERRLFKHPCSYLIYSQAFDELPSEMRDYVWQRLWDVLVQNADQEQFAHLSVDDRRAIVDILRATKLGLPDYWTAATGQGRDEAANLGND